MSIRRSIVLALTLALLGCTRKEHTKEKPSETPKGKPYIIVGRYDERDVSGPRFSWPGTQVRARFRGASVAVDMLDDGATELEWSVDGSPPVRFAVERRVRKTYPLAAHLAPGEHELVLTKCTEAAVGMTQLFAVKADLVGTPPLPAGTRRIEMIGDSITAGYGVLGTSASCAFSPGTEDEGKAWGALAAKELGAVHTAIAWSGIGLYRNWEKTLTNTMADNRYFRALADDPASTWKASDGVPDVIVLALGTNDFASSDPGEPFVTTLTAFLGKLRGLHGKAPIVLATSPMLMGEPHAAQKRYFTRAIETGGDKRVSLLDVEAKPEEGLGCDGHPNAVTHRRMATLLAAHLKPLLGW